jgi:hypothetical protein
VQLLSQQTASTQNAEAQLVAEEQACPFLSLQFPAPSQALLPMQAFAGTMSSISWPMKAQVPFAPVQAEQVAQVEAQQWPSMHWPLHWLLFVQAEPSVNLQLMSWPAPQEAPQGVHAEGQ